MFLLKLFVKEQVISYDLRRPLVADSVGQAFVEFDFDEEWSGLTRTANFENSATESPVSVLLTGSQVEIPPEVLVPGYLQISVVGMAAEGEKQVPTAKMTAPIKVYAAGPGIGAVPEGSMPELWEQVLAVIGQVSKLDTKDKSNLVAAINEVLRKAGTGGGSGSGADGATFIPHISEDGWLSWTNDQGLPNPDPVNIKGKDGAPGAPGQPGEPGVQGVPGTTFIPSVSDGGVISWTNNGGLDNPEPANLVEAVLNALPNGDEVYY